MIKDILKMGHPKLLQPSVPIEDKEFNSLELNELITDLLDTMHHYNGVGIAAVQIGILKQIALIEYSNQNPRYANLDNQPLVVVINPQINPIGDTTVDFPEGCLSIPNMRGLVTRPKSISYKFFNQYGQLVTGQNDGFFARVLLHEIDHMQGKLYPMRIKDMTTFGFVDVN